MDSSSFLKRVDQKIRSVIHENSSPFLEQMILDHFNHPGKMLRPQMVYGLGKALDVSEDSLVAWAAACEIFHNATLIHDDLQDGDETRRGHPTTWKKYGAAQAINAGDLLLLCGQQAIYQSSLTADKKIELASLFSQMTCKIVNGQTLEFQVKELSQPANLEQQYIECIGLKTAALFADLAQGVSILAHQDKNFQNKIHFIYDLVGKIFQIQDDILDLYGDKGRGQKGCDLQEGKMSFLVVTHLKHHPDDSEFLKSILFKPREHTTLQDIESVEKLFNQKHTLKSALDTLKGMISSVENTAPLEIKDYTKNILETVLKPIRFLI